MSLSPEDQAKTGDNVTDAIVRLLAWVGFVHIRQDGSVRWPVSIDPWWMWKIHLRHGPRVYLLRNSPGVIKWLPGRLLPRRWGIVLIGLEIGDRGD